MSNSVEPHHFRPRGWRFWICSHCYAPRNAHPIHFWATCRPLGDNHSMSVEEFARAELRRDQT